MSPLTRIDILAARLEEAYRTSRFHSFLASIKGVSGSDARWIPPDYRGYPHMDGSILNLAYHTAGDKHVLMSVAFGDASVTWPVIQSRFESLGGDLNALRTLAEEGHALVLHHLREVGEEGLESTRPYYHGKRLPAHEVFTIIAEHDLYHAGQIQYARNLLAGRGQANELTARTAEK